MIFLILSLVLPLPAAPAADSPSISLISICGTYDPVSRALAVRDGGHVIIGRAAPAPAEAGRFCFRGDKLSTGTHATPSWVLEAKAFQPAADGLRYPVLICASLDKDFSTLWNGGRLWFRGPFPAGASPHGWCGDGTSLPSRIDNGWYFDNERFRAAPDPFKRSGMSIGNQ